MSYAHTSEKLESFTAPNFSPMKFLLCYVHSHEAKFTTFDQNVGETRDFFELKLDFQKVPVQRGSTVTQFLPDNMLLLWTDTQAAAWLGKKKKKTRHAEEHVQQTLGMFRYLFRYSRKEEEGRKKRKRKKEGGFLNCNRHTNRGTV